MDRGFPDNFFEAALEHWFDSDESEDSNDDEFEDVFND